MKRKKKLYFFIYEIQINRLIKIFREKKSSHKIIQKNWHISWVLTKRKKILFLYISLRDSNKPGVTKLYIKIDITIRNDKRNLIEIDSENFWSHPVIYFYLCTFFSLNYLCIRFKRYKNSRYWHNCTYNNILIYIQS